MPSRSRTFASDNNSGIHPTILDAIVQANAGHAKAYGADPFTERACLKFQALFKKPVDVYFTFNGTGANVLGLQSLTRPYHAILCTESAHIQNDECGAPERFTGCKLIPIPSPDGKLTADQISKHLKGVGDPHHVQPQVISITQSTEFGTLYRPEEIRALSEFAHAHGLYLHMDGARISNAAAALNLPLAEFTQDAGVDVLSFGGTKNGLMYGEAVVILNPQVASGLPFIRKQSMQLASKMRFIAAQFEALLTDDLWLKNARHSNAMATLLAQEASRIPEIQITQKVQANAVFAVIPKQLIAPLQSEHFFYVWNETTGECRWMTSFDTTPEDIDSFIQSIRQSIRKLKPN